MTEQTGKRYLDEFVEKYPFGADIAPVPSTPVGLVGKKLDGKMYLEVPVQTATPPFPPVPQSVLQHATDLNIYTQFSQVTERTGKGYLDEFVDKYSPDTIIADVPSTPPGFAGRGLEGEMYLEVPVQDVDIPGAILEKANGLRIKIRDSNGRIYNP